MEKKELQKKIRKIIVGRNTLLEFGKSKYAYTEFGKKSLNKMACELHNEAIKINKLLPYYLAIKAI